MADYIYWIEFPATIRRAPLAGGGTVDTIYDSPAGTWNIASGLAIDPAGGYVYWTSHGDDGPLIRRTPLAGGTVHPLYGSADGVNDPFGVAVDPAGGRIYWSNGGDDTIRRAPLDGAGPVDPPLYDARHGVSGPTGMAIDPATGQIYWCDAGIATIRGAPLAGTTGGGRVISLYGPPDVAGPAGVAIDAAAGRIYWTNWQWPAQGGIRGARVAGAGAVDPLYDSTQVTIPGGVAVDPNPAALARLERGGAESFAVGRWLGQSLGGVFSRFSGSAGRIYWSNGGAAHLGVGGSFGAATAYDDKILGAPLAGHGSVDPLYATLAPPGPGAIALLRAPLGAGPPVISLPLIQGQGPFGGMPFGGSQSGPLHRPLVCSRGTWAPDLLGSHLYRAPHSFAYQWRLNGTDISGATAAVFTATAPGSYSCEVTATNEAGSAKQTSPAVAIS